MYFYLIALDSGPFAPATRAALRGKTPLYMIHFISTLFRFALDTRRTDETDHRSRPNNVPGSLEGSFYALLLAEGYVVGPQIGIIKKYRKAAQRFSPVSRRFWSGLGLGLGFRRGVGSTPVPRSHQERLTARKREKPTAPKIRATRSLGELDDRCPLDVDLSGNICAVKLMLPGGSRTACMI